MITVVVGITCFFAGVLLTASAAAGKLAEAWGSKADLRAEVEHYKTLYGIEAGQVDDLLRGSGFQ